MEKTSAITGFISRGVFSGGREIHKLLHTGLVKHPARSHIQLWSATYQKNKLKIDAQTRGTKPMRRIMSLSFVRILQAGSGYLDES